MTKLSNAVLALAAALLATSALAQVGFLLDSEQVTVPAELFGGDAVELEFDMDKSFAPKAKLIMIDGTAIGDGTTFSVTYTLAGSSTFAEEVSNDNFKWGSWGPTPRNAEMDGCMVLDGPPRTATATAPATAIDTEDPLRRAFCPLSEEMQIARVDGSKGASSVTFNLEAQMAIGNPNGQTGIGDLLNPSLPTVATDPQEYTGTTRKIVFVLPDVNAMGMVDVTAAVEQKTSGGTATPVSSDFRCYVASTAEGADEDAKMKTAMGCATKTTVVATHAVIDGGDGDDITNVGADGKISLEDRKTLVGADDKTAKKITLSTIKVIAKFAPEMGTLKDQNGNDITAATGFAGELSGDLLVTVSSDNFNPGDVVSVGTKEFTIADGEASGSVDLGTAAVTVSYAPGGEDPLKHGAAFTINAKTQFNNDDNANTSADEAESTLTLSGIDDDNTARAYAIAPLTSTDMTNVRVTCEAAQGCQIFLDCKDHSGVSTFYEDGAMLDGYTTTVWQQGAIGEALGLMDGWAGRLSCEVLSTAPVTVQVLTRAAGVLVNNTYVDSAGNSGG